MSNARAVRFFKSAQAGDRVVDSVGNGWTIIGNDGTTITYRFGEQEQAERIGVLEAMGYRLEKSAR